MPVKEYETGKWMAYISQRHPITRKPCSIKKRGLKSEHEARRIERQLIVSISNRFKNTYIPKWETFLISFITSMKERGYSYKTIDSYEACLKAHTQEWLHRRADTITASEVCEIIKVKLADRSPHHQRGVLKMLRAAFNYGLEIGMLDKNPVPQLKFRMNTKLKAGLNEDQVRTLLEKAKEFKSEWYYHWTLAVYTGMRNGELYALTWDKINLDQRTIKVDCSWNNKAGFKDTKSGDDRYIEIAPTLLDVLKELYLQTKSLHFVLPRHPKWDKGEQARELRMFLQGLGLPIIRFHDLRATWATILLSKGVEPIKVMKLGGWKDIKTMQIYVRKSAVDIRGATDKLNLHNPNLEIAKVIQLGCSPL